MHPHTPAPARTKPSATHAYPDTQAHAPVSTRELDMCFRELYTRSSVKTTALEKSEATYQEPGPGSAEERES